MKIFIEKENTLEINEQAKLVLINTDEFVSTIKRESGFVPAGHIRVSLKYKLICNNNEYNGESIFDSYKDIVNIIDSNCPYKVELINWKLSDKEEKYFEFNFINNEEKNLKQIFKLIDKKDGYQNTILHFNYDFKENIKLQICYLICNSSKIDLLQVEIKSNDGELNHSGIEESIHRIYKNLEFKGRFSDFKTFCEIYKDFSNLTWEVKMNYCNTEVTISSVYLENAIGVSYLIGSNVDIMPLLLEIESKIDNINGNN